MGEEINPASVGGREGERVSERGGGYIDGSIVELDKHSALVSNPSRKAHIDKNITVSIFLLKKKRVGRANDI